LKRPPLRWADACAELESALSGPLRREIVEHLGEDDPFEVLREGMRQHTFVTDSGEVSLRRIVTSLDQRSRKEGLHLVQAWDFEKQRHSFDNIPVLLLDYCVRLKREADDKATAAVLLDQYFLTVLSLFAVRAWDEGDPNANLDRVSSLLKQLQGPQGSGHTFVDDAESLLFLAISYFHPDEAAYNQLLAKVETLDAAHQLRVALPCAAMMSGHFRWGLRFMYNRDIGRLRDDNVVDYPWLAHAAARVAAEYASSSGDQRAIASEALLQALAADPWALTGALPPVLRGREKEHALVREVIASHRDAVTAEFEAMRPKATSFSPLSFTCNFPTNAAVAKVAVSLEDGRAYPSINTLLTARRDPAASQALASRLMDYSVSDPSRLGKGKAPLISYDPFDASNAFNATMRCLRGG
jgi:hypothetical protein